MDKIIHCKTNHFLLKNESTFLFYLHMWNFFYHDWQINFSEGTVFENLIKIWKNLLQLIPAKIYSNKVRQLTLKFSTWVNCTYKICGFCQNSFWSMKQSSVDDQCKLSIPTPTLQMTGFNNGWSKYWYLLKEIFQKITWILFF